MAILTTPHTASGPTPGGDNGTSHQSKLKQGTLGTVLITSLGVSFVISGDFAGWQFGLADGGWGGMAIALGIVTVLYLTMCMSLAELSSALPSAGGGHRFATTAFGPLGGFITAAAIVLEYVIAPAAIATFIGSYVESLNLFGLTSGWPLYLACYIIFVAIHLAGAGEALKLMLGITGIAVFALIAYTLVMVPHFEAANLTTGVELFPNGATSVWAAIPFAIWFYLAVEGVPMAAEEARDPHRTIPRSILGSMFILMLAAGTMLVVGPGAAGVAVFAESGNPLVSGLEAVGANPTFVTLINVAALIGLVASFFSIMYGYSRLIYSLSNDNVLPPALSRVNGRGVPTYALVIPAAIGFTLTLFIDGDTLMSVAVFGAVISYALMMASHIKLRITNPDLPRPYKTPGGIITSGVAFVLACGAIVSAFVSNFAVGSVSSLVLVAMTIVYVYVPTTKKTPATDGPGGVVKPAYDTYDADM